MATKDLTKDTFKDGIASGFTLVDFWADWCTPCKMISPAVEELSEELKDKMQFAKVDTDANSEVAIEYGIQSLPTLAIFKDGALVDRLIGAVPKSVILDFINKNISA